MRIAAYARHDHYADLRRSLEAVAVRLRSEGWRAVVVADDNALVDRAAAVRAGIGWWGRNANVLLPGRGSWFVLGSVVTDAPLPPSVPLDDGCGTCRQCLDGCPTGAILERGVIDARRCLAWLVQAPGPIPREFREALGGRLYGCDECQEVCPVGRSDRNIAGSTDPSADVDIAEVLDASDEELREKGTELPWGRLGTIEDMGKAATYLCSDAADYVTGSVLRADGGFRLVLRWLLRFPWCDSRAVRATTTVAPAPAARN